MNRINLHLLWNIIEDDLLGCSIDEKALAAEYVIRAHVSSNPPNNSPFLALVLAFYHQQDVSLDKRTISEYRGPIASLFYINSIVTVTAFGVMIGS
ncbi:unnamed protein product [Arctia plantaginis]|uniref:Uncharacterized protein n=1 Tax=Arctia plantaginis TaxID=874455 RepID=A0A8S0YPQ0_ARCPL|nr:unnamed protein product [Arctia plantaginis]